MRILQCTLWTYNSCCDILSWMEQREYLERKNGERSKARGVWTDPGALTRSCILRFQRQLMVQVLARDVSLQYRKVGEMKKEREIRVCRRRGEGPYLFHMKSRMYQILGIRFFSSQGAFSAWHSHLHTVQTFSMFNYLSGITPAT